MRDTIEAKVLAWSQLSTDRPMPLLDRRRVIGERAMVSHVHLAAGCFVPTHSHENEQITCVLQGRLQFGLGEANSLEYREAVAGPGDVVFLPSGCPHSARALEDTVVLDVFAPPSSTTGIDKKE